MQKASMERRNDIDLFKGIAILAIVFYHVGLLPYGFAGVEIFLTVSGFLLIPKLTVRITSGEFHYFPWLFRHLFRIWPITLAASTVCLIAGYFLMYPDSYENLAESVVASDLFANNFLGAIATRNYWDSINEYKPLMQMWYLGILAQFYVLFPVVLYLSYRCLRKFAGKSWDIFAVAFLGSMSLIAYFVSETPFTQKFYFLQYRIWEFAAGGIAGLLVSRKIRVNSRAFPIIVLTVIVMLLCYDFTPLSGIDNLTIVGATDLSGSASVKMTVTVIAAFTSALFLTSGIRIKKGFICFLGMISLSIFVWHQVILAFLRGSFIETFSVRQFALYLFSVLAVGYISYITVERIKLKMLLSRIIFFIMLIAVTFTAFMIYRNAGVVRDVPELGITLDNPYANRNTEFIDRFYGADREFTTDKVHVLVIGPSYARDFAGILLMYDKEESLEISYKTNVEAVEDSRLRDADYMFYFGPGTDIPVTKLRVLSPDCKVYGISTKYFGRYFGLIYANRNKPGYFKQTVSANAVCDSINSQWARTWPEGHFIDLMKIVKLPDGSIPVFTDTNKAISFDCRHLTPDGCEYYSRLIDFRKIFTAE